LPARAVAGPVSDLAGGRAPDVSDELRADCARCVALCCLATGFERSPDFGCTKAPGVPCAHLGSDDRCTIHPRRMALGFGGCVAYECWGAGQRVTGTILGDRSWRGHPDAERAFAVFRILVPLHHLRAILVAARALPAAADLVPAIDRLEARLDAVCAAALVGAVPVDPDAERSAVDALLRVLRA
jgi:hypothetical protein